MCTIFSEISCSPPEIHILVPVTLWLPSPTGSAVQRISDSDEPAWGSDKHMVPNQRPSTRAEGTAPQRLAAAGLQHAGIRGCQEDVASSRRIGRLKDTLHEVGNHDGQLHAAKIMIKRRRGQTGLNEGFQASLEESGVMACPSLKIGSFSSCSAAQGKNSSSAMFWHKSSMAVMLRGHARCSAHCQQRTQIKHFIEIEIDVASIDDHRHRVPRRSCIKVKVDPTRAPYQGQRLGLIEGIRRLIMRFHP
ncbi:MAG: hypothetical protein CM15mP74_02860 [Halieaceae bacterium]|nr:MAG: hypothetical protein CM15mP74_02860 [Halieaceae bacterium]